MKQIWYIGASGWFYYRNDITMRGPMNSTVTFLSWLVCGLHKELLKLRRFMWLCKMTVGEEWQRRIRVYDEANTDCLKAA